MENTNRSQDFFNCLNHIHTITDELYEDIHDDSGNPILEAEALEAVVAKYRRAIDDELATIINGE